MITVPHGATRQLARGPSVSTIPVDAPGDGVDTRLTTFRYDDGRYDRFEREFYGYGTVVTEDRDAGNGDALYRSLISEYRTDSYPTRGLLAKQTTADAAGRRYSDVINTYEPRDVATGAPADLASPTATVVIRPKSRCASCESW